MVLKATRVGTEEAGTRLTPSGCSQRPEEDRDEESEGSSGLRAPLRCALGGCAPTNLWSRHRAPRLSSNS